MRFTCALALFATLTIGAPGQSWDATQDRESRHPAVCPVETGVYWVEVFNEHREFVHVSDGFYSLETAAAFQQIIQHFFPEYQTTIWWSDCIDR